jgi:hypothetical protein
MNNKTKIIILLLLFCSPAFVSDAVAAGMGMGMGMGPPCGPPFPPCPIPLDSGVVLLLVAGATFGGWKLYSSLKKNPA